MRLLALAVLGFLGCGRFGFEELEPDGVVDGGVRELDGGHGDDGGNAFGADAALPNCFDVACLRLIVDRASFLRDNNTWYPAMTSAYVLDRYEVTVARFREFVAAGFGTRASPPDIGAGAHVAIASSGWTSDWSTILPVSTEDLAYRVSSIPDATFTPNSGSNERLPIVGVTWYEAFAFCIWDGGFLPSAAEWNYAAAAGSEQRTFPWGSYNCGPSCANSCVNGGAGACPSAGVQAVGYTTSSPGKWTQWDLAGNVAELSADRPPSATYSPPTPCDNCADMRSQTNRVAHGGSWDDYYQHVTASFDTFVTARSDKVGFRCARLP